MSAPQPPAEAQPVAWRGRGKNGWTFTDSPHAHDIAVGIWEPLYTAPPSAPVGVEGVVSALQSMRDRMMTALPPKFGDAFDGDFDTLLEAINAFKAGRGQNLVALAQQPAAVDGAGRHDGYCEGYCRRCDEAVAQRQGHKA